MINDDSLSILEPETWSTPVRDFYNYWLSIHPAPNKLPSRKHFDPLDIPKLLPKIWMFDVFHDPFRCKFRLAGTEIAEVLGKDTRGQWMDEAFPDILESGLADDYQSVAKSNRPVYRNGSPQYYMPDHRKIERLILPLVNEKQKCEILLGISIYK